MKRILCENGTSFQGVTFGLNQILLYGAMFHIGRIQGFENHELNESDSDYHHFQKSTWQESVVSIHFCIAVDSTGLEILNLSTVTQSSEIVFLRDQQGKKGAFIPARVIDPISGEGQAWDSLCRGGKNMLGPQTIH